MSRVGELITLFPVKVREMESLERRWQQLNLTNDEDNEIIVEDELLIKEPKKGKYNIFGKLQLEQSISKETLRFH